MLHPQQIFKTRSENSRTSSTTRNVRRRDTQVHAKYRSADGVAAYRSIEVVLPSLVSSSQSARKESSEAKKRLQNMFNNAYHRQDVYDVLRKASSSKIRDEDKFYVEKTLAMFERSGASIVDPDQRKAFTELKRKITEQQLNFEQNINEDTSFVLFEDHELVGVDKNFISSLPKTSDKTKRKVVLKRPLTHPILQRAHLSSTRKKLVQALGSKCSEKNSKLMQELLKSRSKLARLMGYKSHSDFMLQSKMASNLGVALSFCKNMIDRMEKKLDKELNILREVKKSRLHMMKDENEDVEAHDLSYLIEIVKQRDFNIDSMYLFFFFLEANSNNSTYPHHSHHAQVKS